VKRFASIRKILAAEPFLFVMAQVTICINNPKPANRKPRHNDINENVAKKIIRNLS
jgi:hypothetical protein